MIRLGSGTNVEMCVCLLSVKRYSMALHAGELQTLSIFELLEYIVSEVSLWWFYALSLAVKVTYLIYHRFHELDS